MLGNLVQLKATLERFQALWSVENKQFLVRILDGMTDPTTPGYQEFWGWFRGGYRDPEAYARAYRALRQLAKLIKEQ